MAALMRKARTPIKGLSSRRRNDFELRDSVARQRCLRLAQLPKSAYPTETDKTLPTIVIHKLERDNNVPVSSLPQVEGPALAMSRLRKARGGNALCYIVHTEILKREYKRVAGTVC